MAVELEELSFCLALFCKSCYIRSTSAPSTPASDSRLPSSVVYCKAFPCADVDFRISHVMCLCSGGWGDLELWHHCRALRKAGLWECGHHPYNAHGQATTGGAELAGKNMEHNPAHWSNSVLGIRSCQQMPRMHQRQQRWKRFSLLSWSA